MKKTPLTLLMLSALTISSFVIGISAKEKQVNAAILTYTDLIKAKPGMVSNSYLYESVMNYSFEPGSIGYFDIADSTTKSITYEFGYENNGIGSALYLDTPGGGFNTRMRCRTYSNTDISSSEGVMFYIDFSSIKAEGSSYVGVGLGLMFMDSSVEPPSGNNMFDESHRSGHFRHYYPVETRTAYYYDLFEGRFMPTTIINNCAVVKEGYQGWIYIPFTSYGWNGNSDSKYAVNTDAFDEGYKWLNYSHFLTSNFKSDDTQSRIYFDELTFIKRTTQNVVNYEYQSDLAATCFDVGGKIYKDSSSNNYKLTDITNKLTHDYQYLKFKDGAIGVCSHCNDLVFTRDAEHVGSALNGDVSNYIDVHFHYGKSLENEEVVIVNLAEFVSKDKEPRVNRVTMDDSWDYDFSAWSSDTNVYTPKDPKVTLHMSETHYFAKYLISSYDNVKYSHVPNLLALHGGRYKCNTGKIVMNGNSNFALAYNTTSDYANRGLPLINNAVAGGSSYDYYYYADQLVVGYAPKILLFNLTTNDQAYWSMSEKDIIDITKQYVARVHEALPDCIFAVVNGSPLPGRSEMFATVERVNNQMKKYAETVDYIYFIDTYDFVYERMMEYPDGWEFWTHMETDTLSTWMNLIADGIDEIVAERGIVF